MPGLYTKNTHLKPKIDKSYSTKYQRFLTPPGISVKGRVPKNMTNFTRHCIEAMPNHIHHQFKAKCHAVNRSINVVTCELFDMYNRNMLLSTEQLSYIFVQYFPNKEDINIELLMAAIHDFLGQEHMERPWINEYEYNNAYHELFRFKHDQKRPDAKRRVRKHPRNPRKKATK